MSNSMKVLLSINTSSYFAEYFLILLQSVTLPMNRVDISSSVYHTTAGAFSNVSELQVMQYML